MTRVAQVIARLNVGGAALCVISLTAALNSPDCANFEAFLVAGTVGPDEGDMAYSAVEQGVSVTIVPELGRELSVRNDLVTLYKLFALFRSTRPEVVHTNTAKAGFVGRVAAKMAGVPVIVHTFHGHVFQGYFSARKTKLFLFLERMCARLCSDRIIALSAELKRQLAEQYHVCAADKISVIPNGLKLDDLLKLPRHNGTFRTEHAIPSNAPLIGIVGRLVPIKNHELFFRAARIVLDRQPDAYFAVVGDGERRAELTALAESSGLADRTRFTGWITDVKPVYSALDALVLCSHNEGLPISLIEAMAAGVPVAATNVGGVPDLLTDPRHGALVSPDDPEALAEGILSGLRGQFDLEGARAFVKAHASIESVASQTAALYNDLLARKHQTHL